MKKTVRDFKLKSNKVIIRCDLNVPIKKGIIQDDTRIKESIKTIAIGIYQQSGLTSKQINNMLLSEVKKAKNIIDETIKIEKEKENNEKN